MQKYIQFPELLIDRKKDLGFRTDLVCLLYEESLLYILHKEQISPKKKHIQKTFSCSYITCSFLFINVLLLSIELGENRLSEIEENKNTTCCTVYGLLNPVPLLLWECAFSISFSGSHCIPYFILEQVMDYILICAKQREMGVEMDVHVCISCKECGGDGWMCVHVSFAIKERGFNRSKMLIMSCHYQCENNENKINLPTNYGIEV